MSINPDLARILQALAESTPSNNAQPTTQRPPSDPRLSAISQPTPTPPFLPQQNSAVDPCAITKWPASVRYVTSHIMTDPTTMQRLKSIKDHQSRHEKLWWEQREALVNQHRNRAQAKLQMKQIFQNLGTSIPILGNSPLDSEEEHKKKLKEYDEKMHKACIVMVEALSNDLKVLNVPFFCCKDESQFEPGELNNLKKKMIEFLEDIIE